MAAKKIVRMMSPLLLPAERRDFFRKVYHVCRRLAARGIGLSKLLEPSLN